MDYVLFYSRLYFATNIMSIWHPLIWEFLPNANRKRSKQLFYRTKGIVLHDQIMNGEQSRYERD